MRQLWLHSAVEQLQHLIVRRSMGNGVARQDVIRAWYTIQRDMTDVINEMDLKYAARVDAISLEKEARNESMVGSDKAAQSLR